MKVLLFPLECLLIFVFWLKSDNLKLILQPSIKSYLNYLNYREKPVFPGLVIRLVILPLSSICNNIIHLIVYWHFFGFSHFNASYLQRPAKN
ncbi:uncharacterized protein RJT20DRAFT_127967 [Scheffersomyces xylosifermentans]|uniref:uncharacterized protein n=1 Tax=Scheffersomyces xylosifermentans TaxID=1304137 RepID=UPI00315C90CC